MSELRKIYLPRDAGTVVNISGVCYHRKGNSTEEPDTAFGAGDMWDYGTGGSWGYDDNNNWFGGNHRKWSGCQLCVIFEQGFYGVVTGTVPAWPDEDPPVDRPEDTSIVLSAPGGMAGVWRVWALQPEGTDFLIVINTENGYAHVCRTWPYNIGVKCGRWFYLGVWPFGGRYDLFQFDFGFIPPPAGGLFRRGQAHRSEDGDIQITAKHWGSSPPYEEVPYAVHWVFCPYVWPPAA